MSLRAAIAVSLTLASVASCRSPETSDLEAWPGRSHGEEAVERRQRDGEHRHQRRSRRSAPAASTTTSAAGRRRALRAGRGIDARKHGPLQRLRDPQARRRLRAYAPRFPLYSDGTAKARYIKLPAGSPIDPTNKELWKFPVGTKIWKEFKTGDRILETRYLEKKKGSGSSALRLERGANRSQELDRRRDRKLRASSRRHLERRHADGRHSIPPLKIARPVTSSTAKASAPPIARIRSSASKPCSWSAASSRPSCKSRL